MQCWAVAADCSRRASSSDQVLCFKAVLSCCTVQSGTFRGASHAGEPATLSPGPMAGVPRATAAQRARGWTSARRQRLRFAGGARGKEMLRWSGVVSNRTCVCVWERERDKDKYRITSTYR